MWVGHVAEEAVIRLVEVVGTAIGVEVTRWIN